MSESVSDIPLVTLPEDTPRRRWLGGSDSAAVMGFGAWGKTPYTVYLSKTGQMEEKTDPARDKFLERRRSLEPYILKMLNDEYGLEVTGVNNRYKDREHPFLAAEIDFEWIDENGMTQNGEIKTVHPLKTYEWGDSGTDDVPVHYAAQAMHGLGVTGRDLCVFAVLVGVDNLNLYKIERDEVTIEEMRKRCVAFWADHVLAGKAPDPQTMADLHHMFKRGSGVELEASDEVASKAFRLRALQGHISALELEAESLEFDVKLAMAEAEALLVGGKRVVTWKEQDWGRLDQAGLKDREPAIYKAFSLKGRHRVFKVNRSIT